MKKFIRNAKLLRQLTEQMLKRNYALTWVRHINKFRQRETLKRIL